MPVRYTFKLICYIKAIRNQIYVSPKIEVPKKNRLQICIEQTKPYTIKLKTGFELAYMPVV